jgi:hypothetical protein
MAERDRRGEGAVVTFEKVVDQTIARGIVLLMLSLLLAPLAATTQPAGKVPTIGLLLPGSATTNLQGFEAFIQSLRELGYIEGQTIAIEQRYAEGSAERLPALATELANLSGPPFPGRRGDPMKAPALLATLVLGIIAVLCAAEAQQAMLLFFYYHHKRL